MEALILAIGVLLFGVTTLCDQLPLGECTAACLKSDSKNTVNVCNDRCGRSQLTKLESNEIIEVICRDADAFVIEVSGSLKMNSNVESYLVRFRESDNRLELERMQHSNSKRMKIENLRSNTSYSVTVDIIHAMGTYRRLSQSVEVRTQPSHSYRPKIIPSESIRVSNFTVDDNDPNLLGAYVQWAPADDMVCHYGMILYETAENNDNQHAFQAYKISDAQQLYGFWVANLVLGSSYHLAIKGVNTKDEANEGPDAEIAFVTPSCWEMHDFSTTLCGPPPLKHLASTHSLVRKGVFNINVTWEQIPSERQPIYYVVSILPHHSGLLELDDTVQPMLDGVSRNVTGDKQNAFFPDVMLTSVDYTIQVEAVSKGGATATYAQGSLKEIYKSYLDKHHESIGAIKILVLIFTSLLVTMVCYIVWYRRWRQSEAANGRLDDWLDVVSLFRKENKANDMEVKRPRIDDEDGNAILGEGAFGIVRRGKLSPQLRTKFEWGWFGHRQRPLNASGQYLYVAVKTLKKDDGDGSGMRAKVKEFLDEIKVMKSVVGRHENVVNIVGHCTTGNDPTQLMLLTELCGKGNLLKYLRSYRKQCPNGRNEVTRDQIDHRILMVENPLYNLLSLNEMELAGAASETLTSANLLSFAAQIASGMVFLANNKIVHRDLAARNVLVCANNTVKIADFGLSRNVDDDRIYTKRSDGCVPLKWLALESIVHQKYSTESDVWSYGILLYEIVTLGDEPYPNLPHGCLRTYLERGERMPQPHNCGNELYQIMRECWSGESGKRPHFERIIQKLDELTFRSHPTELVTLPNSE